MKFHITVQFERKQLIEIEAESAAEAEEIVREGEFEDSAVIDTEDDYIEVSEVTPAPKQ